MVISPYMGTSYGHITIYGYILWSYHHIWVYPMVITVGMASSSATLNAAVAVQRAVYDHIWTYYMVELPCMDIRNGHIAIYGHTLWMLFGGLWALPIHTFLNPDPPVHTAYSPDPPVHTAYSPGPPIPDPPRTLPALALAALTLPPLAIPVLTPPSLALPHLASVWSVQPLFIKQLLLQGRRAWRIRDT